MCSDYTITKFNYNPGICFDGKPFEELRGVGKAIDWSDAVSLYSVANFNGSNYLDQYTLSSVFVSDKKGISVYENYYYADGHGASKNYAANTLPGTFKGSQIIAVQYTTNNTYGSSIYKNGALIEKQTGSGVIAPVTDTFEIGGRMAFGWHTRIFKGNIAEIIVYKGNHSISQRDKIQSYLAVKYGLTLKHSAVPNYLNSSGSSVFSDASGIYWNDIIGIGRDDSSSLLQKQSRQTDDKTSIYLSSLKATNGANPGSFSGDKQYVMIGNNADSLTGNVNSLEYPPGNNIHKRMRREWKIVNSGFNKTFSISINSDFGSNINTNDFCLLVDDDGDFSNASVFHPQMSVVNGRIIISGISKTMIPVNSTKYITIAYTNDTIPTFSEISKLYVLNQ